MSSLQTDIVQRDVEGLRAITLPTDLTSDGHRLLLLAELEVIIDRHRIPDTLEDSIEPKGIVGEGQDRTLCRSPLAELYTHDLTGEAHQLFPERCPLGPIIIVPEARKGNCPRDHVEA